VARTRPSTRPAAGRGAVPVAVRVVSRRRRPTCRGRRCRRCPCPCPCLCP
jgi:hypothetical protein